MKPVPLFKRTAGLNNRIDPVRLRYDAETGVVDLAKATNIIIDDTGRPGRVKGYTTVTAGTFHSAFCFGGDAFVVQDRVADAAIMKVNSDLTTTGVRSGLTLDARMSWCQVNTQTFYTNTHENGYISDGVSAAWPTQTYNGPTTSRDLTAPPKGKHLGFHRGRMIVTEGKVAWFTEYFQFGLLDRARFFVQLPSDIRLVAPVDGGVFMSDEYRTYFFAGTSPLDFTERIVADYPAHEYSLAHDMLESGDLGLEGVFGKCRIWSSTEGVCAGLPDGRLINLTDEKIDFPDVRTTGASLIWDDSFGKQIIATQA